MKPLFDGLEVSYNGEFRRNGKPHKVIYSYTVAGNKATARLSYSKDGKTRYFQASKLVAMAYKKEYEDGCRIIYKDGNIHNISADNLIIVSDKQYSEYLRRNTIYKGASLSERKVKLDMIIKEATLTRNFLDNRDFSDINIHTQERIIPILKDYSLNTIHLGMNTTQRIVPEVVARMYEVIDNGMCLYNYERYCKKLLLNYKKKGSFGVTGSVCKPIWSSVEQLNFDCLWERYKRKH